MDAATHPERLRTTEAEPSGARMAMLSIFWIWLFYFVVNTAATAMGGAELQLPLMGRPIMVVGRYPADGDALQGAKPVRWRRHLGPPGCRPHGVDAHGRAAVLVQLLQLRRLLPGLLLQAASRACAGDASAPAGHHRHHRAGLLLLHRRLERDLHRAVQRGPRQPRGATS